MLALVLAVTAPIALADARTDNGNGNGNSHGLTGLMLVLLLGYFIPSIVAKMRKVPSFGSVFIVNLFLGWTFIGWVVALAMAARSAQPSAQPFPAPPEGTEAVACPRCNAVQNVPVGAPTFECWQCKYVADHHAAEAQPTQGLGATPLGQVGEDVRAWWANLRQWWDSQVSPGGKSR
ncbi:hypothetical protein BST44_21270 [Mycobacterium scrofulaceum]|uniref:Superinfection immunity protein n=1 Tax=Mycobacterium scrofulaceum TaxID=1783 RepID=A0A1X0K955_MYCSC|nr:hypothetical protein BST44_21270 [Mycobacterium scrofulaceum]